MLLIGLTGSIATGKSTVSALLTSPPHSLPLIDADLLARQVVEPGTRGYQRIVDYFGPTTPDLLLPASDRKDGEAPNVNGNSGGEGKGRPLNRPALGRRVFGSTDEKKRDRAVLNGIIHPAVRWEMYRALLYYYVRGYWAVVLDIPLLFESGLDLICGCVVVVAVGDREVQISRLLERDRGLAGSGELTREEAEGRVASQWDVRVKAERCERRGEGRGVVVWNDGEKEDLRGKVEEVVRGLRRESPWWWSWACLLLPPVGVMAGGWQMVRNLMDKWAWERQQRTAKAKS